MDEDTVSAVLAIIAEEWLGLPDAFPTSTGPHLVEHCPCDECRLRRAVRVAKAKIKHHEDEPSPGVQQ